MTARISPGTVAPTGVVASTPRHNMTIPNESRCKVDGGQPTVRDAAGGGRMTSCSTRELGPRFFVSVGMSCIRITGLLSQDFLLRMDADYARDRALDNIERSIPFPCQRSNMIEHARRDAIVSLPRDLIPAMR